MRNDYSGKLYGVGIGPGDPRLLTLKAQEILNEVDTIFVPKASDDGKSCARSIVEKVIQKPKKIVELVFLMTKDKRQLRNYWLSAARQIVEELKNSKTAAFVTIGDPFIYSTYIYLSETIRENYPGVELETIPGISAFNAAASSSGLPLVSGNERLAVLPVTKDLKGLRQTLVEFDTVVLMKVGSKLNRVVSLLKELQLIKKSTLISHVGQSNERIVRDLSSLKDKKMGYLSVIIVKKG